MSLEVHTKAQPLLDKIHDPGQDMGQDPLDIDDIDAALDGLMVDEPASEAKDGGAPGAEEGSAPGAEKGSAPGAEDGDASGSERVEPPELGVAPEPPPRKSPGEYEGRTRFDDLFVRDTGSVLERGSGPEAKTEYLRESLRRAEGQAKAFRKAWKVREGELDALEALYLKEHERAETQRVAHEEATKKYRALEKFVEEKKNEFEAYGKKVSTTFSQMESHEEELRKQLDQLTTAAAKGQEDLAAELESVRIQATEAELEAIREHDTLEVEKEKSEALLRQDLGKATADAAEADRRAAQLVEQLQTATEARSAQERDIEELRTAEARQQELAVQIKAQMKAQMKAQAKASAAEAKREGKAREQEERQKQEGRQKQERRQKQEQLAQAKKLTIRVKELEAELATAREGFEDDLTRRDNAINKLKAAYTSAQTTLGQRDEKIAELVDKDKLHRRGRESTDAKAKTSELEIAAKQEEIERLKGTLEKTMAKTKQLVAKNKELETEQRVSARGQVSDDLATRDAEIAQLKEVVRESKVERKRLERELRKTERQLAAADQSAPSDGWSAEAEQAISRMGTALQLGDSVVDEILDVAGADPDEVQDITDRLKKVFQIIDQLMSTLQG